MAISGVIVWILPGESENAQLQSQSQLQSHALIESRRAPFSQDYNGRIYNEETVVKAPFYWVPKFLRHVYEVPISFEMHPFDGSKTETTRIPFRVQRDETLKEALDKYVAVMDDRYAWKWIGNALYLGPVENGAEELPLCSFDTVISLDVRAASVWDAFVALVQVAQRKSPSGVPFGIIPCCVSELSSPPSALLDEGTIDLTLTDVTVREAACAILDAAPFEMYLKFHRSGSSHHLAIHFSEDGVQYPLKLMSEHDFAFWDTELSRVNPPEIH